MSIQAAQQGSSFQPAKRVQSFGTTVFAEYTALAIQHNAVNLGQGFPNFPAPDFVKEAAQRAIASDLNQYARSAGHPRLINALAKTYGPLFGRDLNPQSEIVITVGATEGIFATVQALIQAGDEVILIEPFYDSYAPSVIMAGGTPIYVPLRPQPQAASSADWVLDMAELEAAFTERTRLLIINTPQNPLGKVFSRAELQQIATLVQKHDVLVLSDEVYEWMTYRDPNPATARTVEHVRIATLPGMWERTVTLGSAGKTFSVTGWKIGWAITSEKLAHAIFMAHQWIPFAVATPLQEAVAIALEVAPDHDYFAWLGQMYQAKRDRLLTVLQEVGLPPLVPDGSYFILVDTSQLQVPQAAGVRRDVNLCRWFTREVGVAAIPPSHFYSPEHQYLTDHLARFCFCKTDEMLEEAARRLQAKLRGR
ncbi:MAG: aminotransferase class I/II-fold pyridoxal phosphate-dependent enzyme [Caldilineaceae bacterium]|nr:aminotransferase class I/II-fold pyridoxal phosphate-dependent enzyme [Caldilineaceae bacterium]